MSGIPVSLACLTTSAALGGAETSLLTLLGALQRLEPRWRVAVIAPCEGPLLDRCRAAGIAVRRLAFPGPLAAMGESAATGVRRRSANQVALAWHGLGAVAALPGYLAALRRTLQALDATIIHTNGIKAHVAAALARPDGARLVWHLHEYVRARPLTARLLQALGRRADALVVNSDSVLSDARAAFGSGQVIRRIYNAVDLRTFAPGGPALDLAALAGMPPDDGLLRVGLLATFGRWKGHDVFLDALARLPRPFRAYIVGGPVYETAGSQWSIEELRSRVAALGLENAVGFTGHVEDVAAAMRALDIVVHASTQPEPFGMVIAEGMATGRSVIAVRAGGAAELFEDRRTAVGVPPQDASALAARIQELGADAAFRARLGAAAREAACRMFSADRMAREFREVYAG